MSIRYENALGVWMICGILQVASGVDEVSIGAGRILKVEGHSGGSNYFGAKRRKNFLVPWCLGKRHCSFIDKLISDVRFSNLLLVCGSNALYRF